MAKTGWADRAHETATPHTRYKLKEQTQIILVYRGATGYDYFAQHRQCEFSIMIAKTSNKHPAHPGRFIWSEVLEPLGLSITEAAQALGVTRPSLSKVINGRASLSSEMALRIEKAFGVAMDTLMRMQNTYDIAEARKKEKAINVLPFQGRRSLPSMKSAS
jgi:addiction module HigA family antidote